MNSGVLLLTPAYSQASFRCSEYFSLAVLCVVEIMCTGRSRDVLSGLPFYRHKLHDPVASIGGDLPYVKSNETGNAPIL
jgi:hypothetical protein